MVLQNMRILREDERNQSWIGWDHISIVLVFSFAGTNIFLMEMEKQKKDMPTM
jgi:hypothetical protein